MAIVLPQGRFNNSSDKQIRDYIAEKCRILSVVGLHGNTFKPHTGTKTSVLLVQKWNDNPKLGALCPKQEDYNIFFATMRKSGKDNSGEKIYRRIVPQEEKNLSEKERERELLLDPHDHLIVDHDLYNHDGMTEDGIAKAFVEFAKKEQVSFFEQSLSVSSFDAEKYERLIDRLEIIEVLFSEALENKDFRIDSEFHQKPPLQNSNYDYAHVGDYLTTRQYGISIEMNEEGKGTKIYRMNEIHNMLCDTSISKFANISSEEIEAFKLEDRDILFNRTNSFEFVGRTGLFKKFSNEDLVFASYLIRARTDEAKILPEYLVSFLNSSLGIWDLKRRARISINQSNINAQELSAVKIPILNIRFQLELKQIFEQAHQFRLEAIYIYQQAEELLLSELGLKDWQPTEENIAVKSFAKSFGKSSRLDAEHYQPKFDRLIQKLTEKVEITRLGTLLTCNQRGKQPSYLNEDEDYSSGLVVVNSKHVREGQVIIDDNRYAEYPNSKEPLIIQTNDVLINGTGVGTIGRCAPYLYQQNALPDNHVTILRTNSLDSVYLSIVINSIVGQYQVEKYLKGSSGQIELYPRDINQFWIWEAPEDIQQSIRNKVIESHQKREQSKQLLEIAKTGV